ncbi:hypothetical protein ILUMI_16991, partial [Ignelater luminosus]
EYENWGMNVNMHKTEYLRIGEEQEDPDLQLRHIKRCEEYKYLGRIIANKGTSENDIKQRVRQGRKCIRILNSLLWSNRIAIATKSTIYRAIVEPILTYESECWQMSVKVKRRVDAVEMYLILRIENKTHSKQDPSDPLKTTLFYVFSNDETVKNDRTLSFVDSLLLGS